MVIHKYPLEITDVQEVPLPEGAQILSIGNQNGVLCLWALVNPLKPIMPRRFRIVGTGNSIKQHPGMHLATVVIDPFVWHVFAVLE